MSTTPVQQPQPGTQPIPGPQTGQMVSQQYVVTINGSYGEIQPPVNIKAIGVTATLQLIITVLIILLGVLIILFGCVNSIDGMPIWTGLCFYMVAGILGRVAVRKRNNCSVIAYMVLSILSAIASCSLMLSLVEALLVEGSEHDFAYEPPIRVGEWARIIIDCSVGLLSLSEMVIAIVASAFCCRGTCCAPPVPVQVQYSPAMPSGSHMVLPQVNGQPLVLPQGQTMLINPSSPPPSYEARSLPEKSALLPSETTQAAAAGGSEAQHSVTSEGVGNDDRQPLV